MIFIGGTSYSGSTLLDMILSNDESAFSCGEVHALAHPFRPHHVNPECGCGDTGCSVWRDPALASNRVHELLFEKIPAATVHVDSSKSIPWIVDQTKRLRRLGVYTTNVLIWKSPEQYRESRRKRGQERGWLRSWLNYHRLYFSSMDSWISVSHDELISKPAILKELCRELGLTYFEGKERYWESPHHTLFGNSTAKIHLHSEESPAFRSMEAEIGSFTSSRTIIRKRHRKLYRGTGQASFRHSLECDTPSVRAVERVLEATDVTRCCRTATPGDRCLDQLAPLRRTYQRMRGFAASLLIRAQFQQ